MRLLLVSVVIACFAAGVDARSGPTTFVMTCAPAKGRDFAGCSRAARRAGDLRSLCARDVTFCALQETVRPTGARTADFAQCTIGGVCRSIKIDDGR
jgi:hypothetical protein